MTEITKTRFTEDELDNLLDQLDLEQLDLINRYVDPDESRLPARDRPTDSRYDCDLESTGPYDRTGLIKFLEDKAKSDKDWDEYKPYVHETRGKVWKAPEERETVDPEEVDEGDIPLAMDLKTDYDELLDDAEEDDLKDIGAILGLNFFPELTKATKFEPVPDEAPNATDVGAAIKQVKANDAALKELNFNNIQGLKREEFTDLFDGLAKNTNLEKLHMCNTGIGDLVAQELGKAMESNKTIKLLAIESNFLSGDYIVQFIASCTKNNVVQQLNLANQRALVLGSGQELAIAHLIGAAPSLVRLGIHFGSPTARVKALEALCANADILREKRTGKSVKPAPPAEAAPAEAAPAEAAPEAPPAAAEPEAA